MLGYHKSMLLKEMFVQMQIRTVFRKTFILKEPIEGVTRACLDSKQLLTSCDLYEEIYVSTPIVFSLILNLFCQLARVV